MRDAPNPLKGVGIPASSLALFFWVFESDILPINTNEHGQYEFEADVWVLGEELGCCSDVFLD